MDTRSRLFFSAYDPAQLRGQQLSPCGDTTYRVTPKRAWCLPLPWSAAFGTLLFVVHALRFLSSYRQGTWIQKFYIMTLRLYSPDVPSILYLIYLRIFSWWSESMTSTSKQHTQRSRGNLYSYHRVLVPSSCALTTISGSALSLYTFTTSWVRLSTIFLGYTISMQDHHVTAASRTYAFVLPLSPVLHRSPSLISDSTFYSPDLPSGQRVIAKIPSVSEVKPLSLARTWNDRWWVMHNEDARANIRSCMLG